jgi:catalase
MRTSFTKILWIVAVGVALSAGVTFSGANAEQTGVKPQSDKNLAQQIFDTVIQVPGIKLGFRPVHAKGIVCVGTFAPSKEAATLSKAPHFQGNPVPVTVRFSDRAPDPSVPDNSPAGGPRGMAIRFNLPESRKTDIISISHNGFIVSDGDEFLALQKAVVATDPTKPHPWPIEAFLSTRPLALKFVEESKVIPASFATEAFFANNAFIFVNKDGVKRAGRYKILPVAGQKHLSEAKAKSKSADFLVEELKKRLATEPIKFRLVVQIPNAGDPTKDPSLVWPDDRKTVDVGTITISSVIADSDVTQKTLAYDPTFLTDGIELSDDPLPALRSSVYALSAHRRQQK